MASSSHASDEVRALLEKLRLYLEMHYSIRIVRLNRLGRGVYRVDRQEGRSWVARIFPAERAVERTRGDAEVLRFLERHDFPAERCAQPEPVSSPGGRSVLVTEYIEGTPPARNESTLHTFGELLGRLSTLPAAAGAVTREAGALHVYSPREGGARNEIDAAISWLDGIEDKVPSGSRARYEALRDQIARADDCHGLPEGLIHPDPVLKNAIVSPDAGLVLIDWTGAGRGPRLAPLAVLAWSGALGEGGWSPKLVDSVVAGYRSHVRLQEAELDRLADVMRVRPLVFACWRFRHSIDSGKRPDGSEWWWPSDELVEKIAERARGAFEGAADKASS